MKTTVVVLLLAASLTANLLLWHRVGALEQQAAAARNDFPLGEMMGYMQRYADKLWYAGTAGNWELANFYQGEIAETADDIAAAHVRKDGVEISQILSTLLPPATTSVATAITARDEAGFRTSYEALVNTCNACHQEAKHGFIHVTVPAGPPVYWNQRFATP